MAENSRIAWTDHTFNPWIGCAKVSPGCAACYAENLMDTRYGRVKWGTNGTRVRTSVDNWKKPLRWNKAAETAGVRARVFCASLSDVFEDWDGPILNGGGHEWWITPDGDRFTAEGCRADKSELAAQGCHRMTLNSIRRDLFTLIDSTPWLDWLLLTKRPENIGRKWIPQDTGTTTTDFRAQPRPNVWLGTTIESQDQIGRWEQLEKCSGLSPVLWVSAEPLLGSIDISTLNYRGRRPDWIVFGGESDQGAPARRCELEWLRDGMRECRRLGIAVFVKQLGSNVIETVSMPADFSTFPTQRCYTDRAGANPDEWPADLRVREFPAVEMNLK